MDERIITIPYAPRPAQREIHDSLKRFNVLVCHRRMGKTVLAVNELLKKALQCEKDRPRYAYMAPLYKQAKAVAWDYVKHYSSVVPGVTYNESELRCDLPNGARITLLGADNPDSLRGIYLDGVVLDEVAQMPPKVWSEVIRPALADREGWALFIGTPKGHNLFYEMHQRARDLPDWFTGVYKASDTNILPAAELASAKAEGMSDDEYAQEFECSFEAAIVGAYWGKEMAQAERENRITSVPWEPQVKVHTFWDLGISDSTVIRFIQQVGKEIRCIETYANNGVGLHHYIKVLGERPYVYGSHNAPHDIEVRELGSGKSRKEIALELGINFQVVPNLPIQDGIDAARAILPRMWFDKSKCAKDIEALKQYRREWDEKNGCFRSKPLHDWTSHYADALRYMAVGFKEERKAQKINYGNVQWAV